MSTTAYGSEAEVLNTPQAEVALTPGQRIRRRSVDRILLLHDDVPVAMTDAMRSARRLLALCDRPLMGMDLAGAAEAAEELHAASGLLAALLHRTLR